MKRKIVILLLLAIMMCVLCVDNTFAYSLIYDGSPIVDKSQAEQFLKDRNASKKMLDNLDFIYDYSEEVGIDPGIVIAMSSIETAYGRSNLFVNHNNPGGIKSSRTSNGWAHYDTIEDGYRGMINLLATYAGVNNNYKSYLFGKATTTQQLGSYYWVEDGCDRGYHNMLSRQIATMCSYPIIKEKPEEKQVPNKIINDAIKKKDKQDDGTDIIYDILNKNANSSGYDLIMNILKNSKNK